MNAAEKVKKLTEKMVEKQQKEMKAREAAKTEYAACKTLTQKLDCLARFNGILTDESDDATLTEEK